MTALPLLRAPTRIVSATVYSEISRITRQAELNLPAGTSHWVLEDLPYQIEADHVQLNAQAGQIVGLERRITPTLEQKVGDEAGQEELRQLKHHMAELSGTIEACQKELEIIDALLPKTPSSDSSIAQATERFLAGLQQLFMRRAATLSRLQEARSELSDCSLRHDRELHRQLSSEAQKRSRKKSQFIVRLHSSTPVRSIVHIRYLSSWATWRPYYRLRLSSGKLEISQFADIWQQTGEDWLGARLKLSTAEPHRGLLLPEVSPWLLENIKNYEDRSRELYFERKTSTPPPPSSTHASAMDNLNSSPPELDLEEAAATGDLLEVKDNSSDDFEQNEDQSFGALPLPPFGMEASSYPWDRHLEDNSADTALVNHPDAARLSREPAPKDAVSGLDHDFEVPGLMRCPSGPKRYRVCLGNQSYPTKVIYLLRPAIKDYAFGLVTLVNHSKSPLVAGTASLFTGESYLGEIRIKTTPQGGKVLLNLGAETAIRSTRSTTTRVRTEGLISKEDVHVVAINISVTNYLDTVANLEIQDQVPVTVDPRVRVRLMRTAPKDARLDERTGILTFSARVEPRKKTDISVIYEIEAPKDYRLVQALGE